VKFSDFLGLEVYLAFRAPDSNAPSQRGFHHHAFKHRLTAYVFHSFIQLLLQKVQMHEKALLAIPLNMPLSYPGASNITQK
jgi:hypothetical protein